ncbi:MAG: ParB N-terminal domain-containing protein [Magnetococcales bacterium]|nr:ParB N-terminal domain-containing protein [Magnetococcales bacterium]
MSVDTISIEFIIINKRLRQIRPEAVVTLAQSIRELGLLNPILITPELTDDGQEIGLYRLIAGYHRLEACRQLGMTAIAANIVTIQTVDQLLAEIDENLCRSELNHLERAEHLAERKSLYEMKYPETRHGACGGGKNGIGIRERTENEINSFSVDTAHKTGATERNIQKAVRRANNISQEIRDAIRDVASIADNSLELDALASLEEPDQKEAVRAVLDGKARSIREVIRQQEEASRPAPEQTRPQQKQEECEEQDTEPSTTLEGAQDWKRKAKDASSTVLAQKERIRTLNQERATLKDRIKALEFSLSQAAAAPRPDLLTDLEKLLGSFERNLHETPDSFPTDLLDVFENRFMDLLLLIKSINRQRYQ